MPTRALVDLVHPSWAAALEPVAGTVSALGEFLREEVAAGRGYLPAGGHVLRAFEHPLDDVRVLIVGQDPYPTPGHAVGLSFSVAPTCGPSPAACRTSTPRWPPTSACRRPATATSPRADRGVLLLNRVLTVRPGSPASHRGRGWESVTAQAISALVHRGPARGRPLGPRRPQPGPHLGDVPRIESAHPRHCPPAPASSAPGRSAGPTSCCASREPSPSIGACRDPRAARGDPPARTGQDLSRYVAIGDSFTEGMSDVDPHLEGQYIGWADRLAAHLATLAGEAGHDFAYANLAVRGRLLADVIGPQLDAAIALGPDLVSMVGGGNDILRARADLDSIAARLEAAVVRIRAAGADVLLATPVDPADAPSSGTCAAATPSTPPTSSASPSSTAATSSTSGACTPCATGGCGPRTAST